MPRELTVRTPENVEITYSLSGLGSRFLAVALDMVIQVVALLSVLVVMGLIASGMSDWFRYIEDPLHLSSWMLGLFFVFVFLDFWGYYIFFETIWNGQTPGKRAVGIRVVKENGQPVDFFTSSARNLVRIIDWLPGSYGIGILSIFISPSYKRLGDYAGGTVVVKEYREPRPRKPATKGSPKPAFVGAELESTGLNFSSESGVLAETDRAIPGVSILSIRQVTREEYEAAQRYLQRRPDLSDSLASDLARRISEPILTRIDMTPDDPASYPYMLFLETLVEDYLRWYEQRY